ncbi:MAG: FecR domain-containing protein [Geminicoccaceae bacterium]
MLVSAEGSVERQDAAGSWAPVAQGATLCRADSLRTGKVSRAAVALANDAVLRLDQDTTLKLEQVTADPGQRARIGLLAGALQSFSRKPHQVDVGTPFMNLAIRGTEFGVRVGAGESVLSVQEGEVLASNATGELAVPGGQSAVARPGQAPQPYLQVRPRDAVQWALYYPPVLALRPAAGDPPAVVEALTLARDGKTAEALARLPAEAADARIQLLRAALLLTAGQVEPARAAIARSLAAAPDQADALALRAVIAVTQNQNEAALADASQAVAADPGSTAARIALSYAQQARFQLLAARDTMLAATAASPGDALAWARLAELQLMLGDRDQARQTAQKAASLAPDLGRVQSVQGFGDLVQFRTTAARGAFDDAIRLGPADPLPRLGLGLAQIRDGDLEQGRRSIEVAVALDPGNALLRSYLGKAYFEERRSDLAGQQFQLAAELDPLDPTSYLFDAIRLQTINRPVEALRQLERSIELNDNRAVYRSQLLLDADRAARGASLSRIYQDLDFLDVGVHEATGSLSLDPTNPAAHRFLADIFGGVRRREVARVSELLQSQMLQPLSSEPVQPALAETNLNIVTQGGPTTPGYNEFTPLFERNQVQAGASGLYGNNATLGGDAVVSALQGRVAASAGLFGYDTDGWRPNDDIRHRIANFFLQGAITPDLSAQFEVRSRRTHFGDIEQAWDPHFFSTNTDRDVDQDSFRTGVRYSPSANSDLLLSFIYSDTNDRQGTDQDTIFGPLNADVKFNDKGYQPEVQYIYRANHFNTTAGAAYYYVDRTQDINSTLGGEPFFDSNANYNITDPRGYVYNNINLPAPVTWTLGFSVDDYNEQAIETRKFNPKLGVQWDVTKAVTLRAAAFQVVKSTLSTNRSLEPTQVAGFNQFFDDNAGTVAQRYGLGLDWKARDDLFFGAEATWRELDVQFFGNTTDENQHTDWHEQTHSLYGYWAATDRIAFTAQFVYDYFDAQNSALTEGTTVPKRLTTYSVPLGIRYFDPSGFFASFGTTFVHQSMRRSQNDQLGLDDGSSSFTILDAQVGYRLPGRYGLISLQLNNILDEHFNYQDDSFRESQDSPSIGPYIPDRQILLYLTLNW